jgi:hypothetical protein
LHPAALAAAYLAAGLTKYGSPGLYKRYFTDCGFQAMGEGSYKKGSFLKAAALALALGIGANSAIFSIEGLNLSGAIYPDPVKLLFDSDHQSRADDSSAIDAVESSLAFANTQGCNLIFAHKGNALLLGDYHIALDSYPMSARIIRVIAGKTR